MWRELMRLRGRISSGLSLIYVRGQFDLFNTKNIKPEEGGKRTPPCISPRKLESGPWAFIDIGIF